MKAHYFVILWLTPMLSWVAIMFLLYRAIPFGDLLNKYYELLGPIGGGDWDSLISEIVIYGAAFLNCIFIWAVAKFFISKHIHSREDR